MKPTIIEWNSPNIPWQRIVNWNQEEGGDGWTLAVGDSSLVEQFEKWLKDTGLRMEVDKNSNCCIFSDGEESIVFCGNESNIPNRCHFDYIWRINVP